MAEQQQQIAIVGTGISGLSAAYRLAKQHKVTVFESADSIGGHTATKTVRVNSGEYHIDTGFIVYNDRTYPNFIKLLNKLGIQGQTTEMGFSVKAEAIDLEYSGCSINALFAKRRSLISIKHWAMLKDIVRFNRHCTRLYTDKAIDEKATLGEFVVQQGYSKRFVDYYLLPMVSAIWSSGEGASALMPLKFFIEFFHNHGLLTVFNQPQWYTVAGGSHAYLPPLTAPFAEQIYVNRPVTRIRRLADKVQLLTQNQLFEFDQVVLACHSDQALALLEDPSREEVDILGAMTYTPNDVVLHTDTRLLPARKRAWASWNYLLADGAADKAVLTYNMNILQNIDAPETFCVSVNPGDRIDPEKILGRYQYHHPLFTHESVAAQQRWHTISGVNRTHYCGAYWRNGFHEDGLVSALKVAESFGVVL